ncbi:MAG: molybdenum ABC transporter ATP-binding protein [Candidatus Sulfotelmatobacter sp.]
MPHFAERTPLAPVLAEDNPAVLRGSIRKRLASSLDSVFQLDIEFSFAPGITIIFGPSGAGKTTLLDCIAGLVSPDSGAIQLGDRVFFDPCRHVNVSPSKRRIGYVFQDLGLFPHMTVEDNIQYGIAGLPTAERKRRTCEVLESFHITSLAASYPAKLSGGERQRVALARALVSEPGMLLLDEPLSGLDASIKTHIIRDLRERNCSRPIPILYVTHSRNEVFALGEHILVLKHGKVLARGTPQDVMNAPRHESVAQMAGFENVFDAEVMATDEHFGVMICRVSGADVFLEVPLAHCDCGERVRVAVRAGDIMLARERPQAISTRNVFPGRVVSLRRHDYLMEVVVDGGALFHTHVTLGACEVLQLAAGSPVWILIKTHSCCLLRPGKEPAPLTDSSIEMARGGSTLEEPVYAPDPDTIDQRPISRTPAEVDPQNHSPR